MDRKNHDGLESEMEEGHNPLTAVADSVASVKAASQIGKKQPLRKGDKQNSQGIERRAKASIAMEDIQWDWDSILESSEDDVYQMIDEMSEDDLESFVSEIEQIDEISTRTLARAAGAAADPDSEYAYGKSHDPQKFADYAKKTKDAKSAAAVQGAANAKGSYPRPGQSMGYDKIGSRQNRSTNPNMVTKAGKLTKTSVKGLKSQMKEDLEGVFAEDLNALVESEATLSESFKAKAEVIFEAALSSKLSEHVERLEEDYQTQLDEQVQQIQESLVEKIDGYLNYVVESWVEENKLAIGNGLRTEIAESFMSALHGVFTEHYIQVPDEKVDLVDGLADKIGELEEQLNRTVQDNIDLVESVKAYARQSVISELAKDLSEAQAEKLKALVEDISFESEDTFAQKVETIKESYFRKVSVQTQAEEELLDENTKEVQVSPMMQQYLNALKK
jgi:mRNA-degrading endonuclease RelE of RelBE toxin-antitoxin system